MPDTMPLLFHHEYCLSHTTIDQSFPNRERLSPILKLLWFLRDHGPQRSEAERVRTATNSCRSRLTVSKSSCMYRFAEVTCYNSPIACRMSHVQSFRRLLLKHTINLHHTRSWLSRMTLNTGILKPWVSCCRARGCYCAGPANILRNIFRVL